MIAFCVQVRADLKTAQVELQQWQQDAHQSAAKVASVSADTESLAAELAQRNQQIASLKVAIDTEAMSAQQLSGKLDARCEEVSSLQGQLHTAQDMARQLQDQLAQADSEMRRLQTDAASASEGQAGAQRDADGLRAQSQSLASRLEDSESRLAVMQESLDKRQQEVRSLETHCTVTDLLLCLLPSLAKMQAIAPKCCTLLQTSECVNRECMKACSRAPDPRKVQCAHLVVYFESLVVSWYCLQVRELNSMLKAWEAMRLSKDAQIAALMERCKRYDEDIAEKGRSNDALRRKLMHHHHASGSARGSVSGAGSERNASRHSVAGSVAGSLSGSDAGRVRHIHLHMHPGGHSAVVASADPTASAEQYSDIGRNDAVCGALVPRVARSHAELYSGGTASSAVLGPRIDPRHSSSRPR